MAAHTTVDTPASLRRRPGFWPGVDHLFVAFTLMFAVWLMFGILAQPIATSSIVELPVLLDIVSGRPERFDLATARRHDR